MFHEPRNLVEQVIDVLGSFIATVAIVLALVWLSSCAASRARRERHRACEERCEPHRGPRWVAGVGPAYAPVKYLDCMDECQGPVIDPDTGRERTD